MGPPSFIDKVSGTRGATPQSRLSTSGSLGTCAGGRERDLHGNVM